RVARDRDRLREQILTGLGWTLHRIWGPRWYRDRSGEERRLREAIERAVLDEQRPAASQPDADARVEDGFDVVEVEARPGWLAPSGPAVLPLGGAEDRGEPQAWVELRELILRTITEEAPIVEDLLVRRVIGAWDAVVSERRREAVRAVLRSLTRSEEIVM